MAVVVLVVVALGVIVGLPSVTLFCIYLLHKPDLELARALKREEVKRAEIQTRMIEDQALKQITSGNNN